MDEEASCVALIYRTQNLKSEHDGGKSSFGSYVPKIEQMGRLGKL